MPATSAVGAGHARDSASFAAAVARMARSHRHTPHAWERATPATSPVGAGHARDSASFAADVARMARSHHDENPPRGQPK